MLLGMKKGKEAINVFFFYFASHNKSKSSIGKIFNEEDVLIRDPQNVQREIERFYSDLGKSNTLLPSENMLNSFFEKS